MKRGKKYLRIIFLFIALMLIHSEEVLNINNLALKDNNIVTTVLGLQSEFHSIELPYNQRKLTWRPNAL